MIPVSSEPSSDGNPSPKRIKLSPSHRTVFASSMLYTYDRIPPDVVVCHIFRFLEGQFFYESLQASTDREPVDLIPYHRHTPDRFHFIAAFSGISSDKLIPLVNTSVYAFASKEHNVTCLWGYFCRDVFRHPWYLFGCLSLHPSIIERELPVVVISRKMLYSLRTHPGIDCLRLKSNRNGFDVPPYRGVEEMGLAPPACSIPQLRHFSGFDLVCSGLRNKRFDWTAWSNWLSLLRSLRLPSLTFSPIRQNEPNYSQQRNARVSLTDVRDSFLDWQGSSLCLKWSAESSGMIDDETLEFIGSRTQLTELCIGRTLGYGMPLSQISIPNSSTSLLSCSSNLTRLSLSGIVIHGNEISCQHLQFLSLNATIARDWTRIFRLPMSRLRHLKLDDFLLYHELFLVNEFPTLRSLFVRKIHRISHSTSDVEQIRPIVDSLLCEQWIAMPQRLERLTFLCDSNKAALEYFLLRCSQTLASLILKGSQVDHPIHVNLAKVKIPCLSCLNLHFVLVNNLDLVDLLPRRIERIVLTSCSEDFQRLLFTNLSRDPDWFRHVRTLKLENPPIEVLQLLSSSVVFQTATSTIISIESHLPTGRTSADHRRSLCRLLETCCHFSAACLSFAERRISQQDDGVVCFCKRHGDGRRDFGRQSNHAKFRLIVRDSIEGYRIKRLGIQLEYCRDEDLFTRLFYFDNSLILGLRYPLRVDTAFHPTEWCLFRLIKGANAMGGFRVTRNVCSMARVDLARGLRKRGLM